ncbi:MAG TPA: TolC family outer membrane protein [Zoogloea sp.]|mgnify:CR=1 FL=1|uniref:TolC family outer membrane protein n=1 Tax=Zoogloea sp. TaxID=49181 RepID=UPI002C6096F8|nr:TolC family outer membrane protein [Zoogloea sp.]HMV17166.1 TolC family outer membrane protein [Rhodocyclaceae bacterium]HMV64269.1 TolC family outer membrane protein [Rhodocyclaceae bacterium]HMW51595.1 TolC family outer membrane protein [Rhodocyclaceae bacterium]HMY49546.1 TolC family outer membrane protein [Rhodocyclaceae bacterium]HMZ75769.1 TolC family outer membrane protein [Rhodocyclaceae bacterium]
MFIAKTLPACLSIAFATCASTAACAAGTLPDAVEKAILRNPEVLARLHEYQAADAERDVARGGYFPRVDLQAYTGRERRDTPVTPTTTYSRPGAQLQLRQLLFDGFATRNDVKRLGYARAVRYFELLGTSDDTALEASRAYLDVLRYRELSDLAKENWAVHKETVDQIERRVKAGVGRRVDLEQAFGRLALAQSNWLTETSNLHDVSRRFERVVGDAPDERLAPAPVFSDKLPGDKEVIAQAVRNNPGFRAAVANIRASRANVDVQRANYAPTVQLLASTGMDKNLLGVTGETNTSAVQVLLNWNLLKGGSDEARIRQSHEQLYTATDLRDKACRDVRQTTAIAWNDVRKLKEQLTYLEQHQLSTEKARDAYRQQFDIGQRSLLDVLNTENELFEAKRATANARFDMTLAELRVLASAHQILPAVQLAPIAKTGPDEAGATEPADDEALRCSADVPVVAPLDTAGALQGRPQPAATPLPATTAMPVVAPNAATAPLSPLEPLLKSWAAAWSAKDLKAYRSFYSSQFKPDQGTPEAWLAMREKRVTKPGSIAVEVDKLSTRNLSATSAEASFVQHYTSSGYSDVMNKTLQFQLENGQWKIVRESNR